MNYTFPKYEPKKILRNHLNLGGANNKGERIDVTSGYLVRNNKPWITVMGEYHFVRDSRDNWYTELCKMRAGGITTVATYMFWIYHEEEEGVFDFTGDRDVREFVKAAEKAGLDVVLRIGPWAHGECRNGGFPDWLLKKSYKLRDTNEEFMALARIWYTKIYEQVKDLFYKDGGPITAIQIENEFVDNAEYLLALKNLAMEIGYDVPIYTVTGWNSKYGAKIPVDEVLPVFGGYCEAPWTGHTDRLPLSIHYAFQSMRNDSAIGADLIDDTDEDGWRLPYEKYPYVTCELGGGIQVTHHRRPLIKGMDAYALSLCKLGSGNNLPGYYMYHGGTNKIGKYSTFNESKATGYPNDYSILSYDFQAPISEYGEIREQYRLLNILHMFINDYDDILAPMELVEPENKVAPEDLKSLRYVMRTNGESGFVFINHYQRLAQLEDVKQVNINALGYVFPEFDVCGDISFLLPFNMDLSGNILETATAQPLCHQGDTYFFVAIDGIKPEYRFKNGKCYEAVAGSDNILEVNNIKIITLTWKEALYARKLSDKLYIGNECDLYEAEGKICAVNVASYAYKCWENEAWNNYNVQGVEKQVVLNVEEVEKAPFEPEYICELQFGGERKLKWKKLTVSSEEGFVELTDECDVSQIYADGKLVADNFYYGKAWRVPARLLYGKECYLVMSEMKDDFYREFKKVFIEEVKVVKSF